MTIDIGLPDGLEVNNSLTALEITRRWFGLKFIFLTFFALFWNGFLVVWYTMVFNIFGSGADSGSSPMELMFFLFPLIHVAVGLWLIYYVIAGYLNKTYIYIDRALISIQHKPIPFWGSKTVEATAVTQLYTKERVTRNKNGTSVSYEVRMIDRDRKNKPLLTGLETSEQALFIEQEIEKFLRISDQRVRGEVGR